MVQSVIIGIFLLLIGAVAVYMGHKLLALRKLVRSFLPVKGKLIKKWVAEKTLASATEPGNTHCVNVNYQFEVNGESYQGDNFYAEEILSGERSMSPKQAQKKIDLIPEQLTVYYNPINPEQSYIYKSGSMAILVLVLGYCFAFGGLIQLLMLLV
jgi:hypothetical protein